MKRNSLAVKAILVGAVLGSASFARADIIGSLYEGGLLNDWGNGSIVPTGTPDVTFSVANGSLDFDSRNLVNGYTVGGFLTSGGGTILTGSGEKLNSMDNVAIVMSGLVSVTHNETFNVMQDDGLVLTINGMSVLNNPGPNSPSPFSGTYTGPTGDFAFQLDYWEIDGSPAVLSVDLPFTPSVPDGGTTAGLLGLGLASLAVLRRKLSFS
jgi:VPDSG-CTERM motif